MPQPRRSMASRVAFSIGGTVPAAHYALLTARYRPSRLVGLGSTTDFTDRTDGCLIRDIRVIRGGLAWLVFTADGADASDGEIESAKSESSAVAWISFLNREGARSRRRVRRARRARVGDREDRRGRETGKTVEGGSRVVKPQPLRQDASATAEYGFAVGVSDRRHCPCCLATRYSLLTTHYSLLLPSSLA
jgi:hypothetical protein